MKIPPTRVGDAVQTRSAPSSPTWSEVAIPRAHPGWSSPTAYLVHRYAADSIAMAALPARRRRAARSTSSPTSSSPPRTPAAAQPTHGSDLRSSARPRRGGCGAAHPGVTTSWITLQRPTRRPRLYLRASATPRGPPGGPNPVHLQQVAVVLRKGIERQAQIHPETGRKRPSSPG